MIRAECRGGLQCIRQSFWAIRGSHASSHTSDRRPDMSSVVLSNGVTVIMVALRAFDRRRARLDRVVGSLIFWASSQLNWDPHKLPSHSLDSNQGLGVILSEHGIIRLISRYASKALVTRINCLMYSAISDAAIPPKSSMLAISTPAFVRRWSR